MKLLPAPSRRFLPYGFVFVGLSGGLILGLAIGSYAPFAKLESAGPLPKIENRSLAQAVNKHFGVPSSKACYAAQKEIRCDAGQPEQVCGTWTGVDANDPYAWQVQFCVAQRANSRGAPAAA